MAKTEKRLTLKLKISVPSIAIDDIALSGGSTHHHRFFNGKYECLVIPGAWYNPPQETPRELAEAILSPI